MFSVWVLLINCVYQRRALILEGEDLLPPANEVAGRKCFHKHVSVHRRGLGYLWSQVPSWSLVHVLLDEGRVSLVPRPLLGACIPYSLDTLPTPPHTHTDKSGWCAPYWNAFLFTIWVHRGFYVFEGEALFTVWVHGGGALTEAGRLHPPPGLLLPVPHAMAGRWRHHHTGVTERRVLQRYLHEREWVQTKDTCMRESEYKPKILVWKRVSTNQRYLYEREWVQTKDTCVKERVSTNHRYLCERESEYKPKILVWKRVSMKPKILVWERVSTNCSHVLKSQNLSPFTPSERKMFSDVWIFFFDLFSSFSNPFRFHVRFYSVWMGLYMKFLNQINEFNQIFYLTCLTIHRADLWTFALQENQPPGGVREAPGTLQRGGPCGRHLLSRLQPKE